jgi:proline dehydrogenase
MAVMRQFFLWSSRQQWLGEQMTRRSFARRAVRKFMPGERVEDALGAAGGLATQGISTVITQLGENVKDRAHAQGVADHYLGVLDQIAGTGNDVHISVKLTQLGLDLGTNVAEPLLTSIIRRAGERGNFVWVDMEDSSYVDVTLQLYRRAREQFPNVGVCLQSYLRRTARDLDSLLPLKPSIRLVKGAYAEPPTVVFPSKREVDDEYVRLGRQLLGIAGKDGSKVGFGTHDLRLVADLQAAAQQAGVARDAFEIQMLYGIRRGEQERLAREGAKVRCLISYGSHWFPWYMRRLAERPANVWFVARSLFG